MERLTTNKKVSEMGMVELAHNCCYEDEEHNARYRDFEMEMDARDFARNLMVTLTKDELPLDKTEFDEEILDNLTIDPFSDVRGLIAVFYRNLWAMADLREKLKCYEDAEEQGLLLQLPCKVGDNIYIIEPYGIEEASITGISEADDIDCFCFEVYIDPDYHEIIALEEFNDTWFLSREEAEAKLKEDAQLKKLK